MPLKSRCPETNLTRERRRDRDLKTTFKRSRRRIEIRQKRIELSVERRSSNSCHRTSSVGGSPVPGPSAPASRAGVSFRHRATVGTRSDTFLGRLGGWPDRRTSAVRPASVLVWMTDVELIDETRAGAGWSLVHATPSRPRHSCRLATTLTAGVPPASRHTRPESFLGE